MNDSWENTTTEHTSTKLSLKVILITGLDLLFRHPKLLVIIVLAIFIDLLTQLVFPLNQLTSSYYPFLPDTQPINFGQFYLLLFPNLYFYYTPGDPILLFVSMILSFLISSFIVSWLLVSFKQIKKHSVKSFNLLESLRESFRFFPNVFLATTLVRGVVTYGGLIGLLSIVSYCGIMLLALSPLFLIFLLLLFHFQVLLTYFLHSIVLDGRGVMVAFSRAFRCVKRYFWTTWILSVLLLLMLIVVEIIFGTLISIPFIFMRVFQALSILFFALAFYEFKNSTKEDISSPSTPLQTIKFKNILSHVVIISADVILLIGLIIGLLIIPAVQIPNMTVNITRIAMTAEQETVLEYIESLDLKTITNYNNPVSSLEETILNNETLNSYLETIDAFTKNIGNNRGGGSFTYRFNWTVAVYESEFSILNTTSFLGSYPNWTAKLYHQWPLNYFIYYLTWWDDNGTQHVSSPTEYDKEVVLQQTNFSEGLEISWVHVGYLNVFYGGGFGCGAYWNYVAQLIFLNANLDLVCFAITEWIGHADP
ncbi:MAG: hypothetical protein ACFFCZ_22430 [Promethearchaeota archaeon]